MSRVPVREALLGLSMEGLVRLEPRRGATVAEITPELVAELVEVRTLLEALNARLAARRHDPEIVALLQDTLRRGNAAAQSGTPEQLARLNAEFHERLAEASRNSVLSDIMRCLRERTSLAFAAQRPRPRARGLEGACRHPGRRDRRRRGARGAAGRRGTCRTPRRPSPEAQRRRRTRRAD